ncbi:SRPBCC family protein [Sinomonas flava]|uniref:SRPBCC family protein n=1 Tax=Sinomonas flava TaxID=496857 RepID=UPI0039A50E5F
MGTMAKNVSRNVTIGAPVDTVFSFLRDPTHWMSAMPGRDVKFSDVEITPDGMGTSAHWSAKMFGVQMGVTHEYREFVPNKRIVSKANMGPVITFSLEPTEAGTTLTAEEGFDDLAPLVRVPLEAIVFRMYENGVEAMLANIKSLVETGERVVTETDEKPKGLHPLESTDVITIAAPVERVFELVKDPAVWLGPDVEIQNFRATAEGVGTTFEAAWRILGIPLKTGHEYTEYVPNEHFTSKAGFGPVFTISVAPEGTGTKLTYHFEDVPRNWAEAAVDSLVMKMSERSQKDLLANIKATAEASSGQS